MNKSVTKTKAVSEQALNKHQKLVFESWKKWKHHVMDTTNSHVSIHDPKLFGANIEFTYDGMGLLTSGLERGIEFLRWMQDNVKGYDEDKIRVFILMNGKHFPILAADDLENCKATVERVNEEASAAYRKTPAYAIHQAELAKSKAEASENFKSILRELRPDFDYLDMGRWLVRYIAAQDRLGSGLDCAEMYQRFENMGYIRNEGITDPVTKPVGLEASIRYVVGQVMSFYKPEDESKGFGPCSAHPMLGEFAAKAVKLHLESALEEK